MSVKDKEAILGMEPVARGRSVLADMYTTVLAKEGVFNSSHDNYFIGIQNIILLPSGVCS